MRIPPSRGRSAVLAVALAACTVPLGCRDEPLAGERSTRGEAPRTLLDPSDALLAARAAHARRPAYDAPPLAAQRRRAEEALRAGPFAVTDKPVAPPSGDKHDYTTLSLYACRTQRHRAACPTWCTTGR